MIAVLAKIAVGVVALMSPISISVASALIGVILGVANLVSFRSNSCDYDYDITRGGCGLTDI